MENISNQLLGYLALFIGVIVGWALCWLWGSVRRRRGGITIQVDPIDPKEINHFKYFEKILEELNLAIKKKGEQIKLNEKPIDAEFVGGEDIKADVESVIKEEKEQAKLGAVDDVDKARGEYIDIMFAYQRTGGKVTEKEKKRLKELKTFSEYSSAIAYYSDKLEELEKEQKKAFVKDYNRG